MSALACIAVHIFERREPQHRQLLSMPGARIKARERGKMLLAAASDTIRCTKQLTTAFRT